MPIISKVSKALKPYLFHGLQLDARGDSDHAFADCPFCSREGKFTVNKDNGLWDCKVCKAGNERGGGNVYTFIRLLWEESDKHTNGDSAVLAKDRKLLDQGTLSEWGAAKSTLTGDWLIPGYAPDGKLNQLYKYATDWKTKKRLLLATPELHHQLFGVPLFDADKPIVYLCEGHWDGMALWETLRFTKNSDQGLSLTASDLSSLYATANVLAVPGCNVFVEQWSKLLDGKSVVLMFDNDHSKQLNGKAVDGAGYAGMKRVANILSKSDHKPKELLYLKWGKDGYDPKLPSGYDVRDAITSGGLTQADRIRSLGWLLGKVVPIPSDWIGGRSLKSPRGGVEMDCRSCSEWKNLVMAWRKAMRWTEGLDRALSVMLSCIASTKAIGDQLWCKIIGPAASGKSTLCEAISVARKHVLAKSTIRGFHSGFKTDPHGDEDNSLVAQLYDKTLVTKDGDTLLQAPNLQQILSEARDLYDSTSRTHYRNKTSRDYQGVRMTWILCGTPSLREIDSSELGERFLDCVIMEKIDDDLEDEILLRVANRAERIMSLEADGKVETQHDPDLVNAMQLTGGYVNYLRENAQELLSRVTMSDHVLTKCIHLGKFVAYMRARPSEKQDESADRECATRLVSQLVRLAKCLAVVLNRRDVDEEVMRRVGRVAMDTARGRSLEILKVLHKVGDGGTESKALAIWTNETEDSQRKMLRFLRMIEALETVTVDIAKGIKSRPRWRLTRKMKDLYEEVKRYETDSV